ncbi:IKS1 [[Candida] subhashii]|uniref:IKS1 n=1 Tax=[Candida] subhashii TaxID=561895 RepID=A0A8J5QEZ5_9ASCO|nr:IKS1 [[Candida] subhashii]KAG7661078.1 IKS1 [[Candida] subhashii]
MSIVPYNSNKDILYHDANQGIVVLHDSSENSIQLLPVSKFKESNNSKRRPSQTFPANPFHPFKDNGNSTKCPNCGFSWSEYRNEGPRRNSNGPTNSFPISFPKEAFEFSGNSTNGFMRRDYFKLLGKLPSITESKPRPSTGSRSTLPEELFNQGYFKRFFRKVEPYILGSGAHAQVYKVNHVLNDIQLGTYAIKRINIGNKFELLEQVLNEVLILYELSVKGANENNLIRYNHVWLELGELEDSSAYILPDPGQVESIKNSSKIPYVFILQQYCAGGHLEDLMNRNFKREEHLSLKDKIDLERKKRRMKRHNGIPEVEEPKKKWLDNFEIWKFFHDVAKGVHYLHVHGILHRDLKPSNCLLDTEYIPGEILERSFSSLRDFEDQAEQLPKVLVSDFGEGKFIDKHHNVLVEDKFDERRGNTGTLEFTAPELWLYSNDPTLGEDRKTFINDFSYESDIYSLGLILCYLCVGSLPFSSIIQEETDPQEIRDKIMNWYYELSSDVFSSWFTNNVLQIRDSIDEGILEFEKLIYMMIKGDGIGNSSTSRIISKDVLVLLEEIKQQLFLKDVIEEPFQHPEHRNSASSGLLLEHSDSNSSAAAAAVVVETSSEEDVEDPVYEKQSEAEHFNLLEMSSNDKNIASQVPPKSATTVKIETNQAIVVSFYCLDWVALEYLSYYTPNYMISACKFSIFCAIGSVLYYSKHKTVNLWVFSILTTIFAILFGYMFPEIAESRDNLF